MASLADLGRIGTWLVLAGCPAPTPAEPSTSTPTADTGMVPPPPTEHDTGWWSPGQGGFFPRDDDGDGFDTRTDCDDLDAHVFPDAPDVIDGVDQDCDEFDGVAERAALVWSSAREHGFAGFRMKSADVDADGCDDLVVVEPSMIGDLIRGWGVSETEGQILVFLGCDDDPWVPDATFSSTAHLGQEIDIWPRDDGDRIVVASLWRDQSHGRAFVLAWDGSDTLSAETELRGDLVFDFYGAALAMTNGGARYYTVRWFRPEPSLVREFSLPMPDPPAAGYHPTSAGRSVLEPPPDSFGAALRVIPDRGQDGHPDLVLEQVWLDDSGEAIIHTLTPGGPVETERWWSFALPAPNDFGLFTSVVGGLSAPGAADLFLRGIRPGAPGEGWVLPPVTGVTFPALVELHALAHVTGEIPDAVIGYQTLAHDFNGDGIQDLAVTSKGRFAYPTVSAGQVHFFWGPIAGELRVRDADRTVSGSAGHLLGTALTLADLDGDGVDELYASAPLATTAAGYGAGAIYRIDPP
jgi:hypothetical protein